MNEKLIKPMSVVRQELIEQLVDDINNCQLPLFVIEYVLQDVLKTVKAAAQEQNELEMKQYKQQLNKQTEASSNKNE
ncbi:MAG: hypothetical protein IJ444_02110 [Kiritimatiellae bacterium]|nr:hypothetical protein [Kiritimatiellia bacterium]